MRQEQENEHNRLDWYTVMITIIYVFAILAVVKSCDHFFNLPSVDTY